MASLQGRVVETYTGKGVPGAVVSIGGQSALTDASGFFTVQNVPLGSYALSVSHRSFQPYAMTVNLAQNMAYSLPATIKIMSVVKAL